MFAFGLGAKKLLRYGYWLIIVVLAANLIPRLLKPVRAANAKIVPYSVTLQDYSINAAGTETPTGKMTMAVRSDGARAIEVGQVIQGKPWGERILTFPSGLKIYVMEDSHHKSRTLDATKNFVSALPNPANNCAIPGKAGQLVSGIEQIGPYRTEKIVSGPVTQWLALDNGCALVKDRAEWSDGQVTEKRLVSLVPGEPAPSIFADPDGYDDVPPSKLFQTAMTPELATNQDAYYYAHRVQ